MLDLKIVDVHNIYVPQGQNIMSFLYFSRMFFNSPVQQTEQELLSFVFLEKDAKGKIRAKNLLTLKRLNFLIRS